MMKTYRLLLAAFLLLAPSLASAQIIVPVGGGGSAPCSSFGTTTGTCLQGAGDIGTPSAGVATNITGLPVGGISATGTPGATTFLEGDGKWATPVGTGNALFGTTTGNTSGDFVSMSNTTVGVQDSTYSPSSFSPAGQVHLVTGSDPSLTAAEWTAFAQFTVTGAGRTLTVPASSTLSANGGYQIDTNASSVVVTANAADTITWNGTTTATGASVTLPVGGLYAMSTSGSGALYISGKDVSGTGNNVRVTSPTLVTPTLGAATATTVNGVTIPSATDTTALLGTAQTLTALNKFTDADFALLGSSSGYLTLKAPAAASTYVGTFPANTGIIAELNLAQNWTAQQSNCVTPLTVSTTTFTPDGTCNNYSFTLVTACSTACTVANPSATPVAGTSGVFAITQFSSAKTLTWGTQYYAAGGSATVQPDATINGLNYISYYVADSTHIIITAAAVNATH